MVSPRLNKEKTGGSPSSVHWDMKSTHLTVTSCGGHYTIKPFFSGHCEKVMDNLPIVTPGGVLAGTYVAGQQSPRHTCPSTRISMEGTNGSHSFLNVKFLEVRNSPYANTSNRQAGIYSCSDARSSVISALSLSSLTMSLSWSVFCEETPTGQLW